VAERFRIDGATPSPELLDAALLAVRRAADRLGDLPTYFETTTAAAFLLFAESGCEAAVLEVGMGGRLDATNVTEPEISAVTRVCLDHTAILGESLEGIAREKAGVMRPARTVVVGDQETAAAGALAEAAWRTGARLVLAAEGAWVSEGEEGPTIHTPAGTYEGLRPALAGRHQWENALTAVRILEELDRAGWSIGPEAVRAAIEEARLDGRLQVRRGDPDLILDGAHNPAAARALAAWLEEEDLRPVLLFACMEDKDAAGMLEALLPRCPAVLFTDFDSPRADDPAGLLELARGIAYPGTAMEAAPLEQAWSRSLELARKQGRPLLAAGSLYLVGAVLERL
jgi:dihydrofolate synthase/folylpolyglutamate synthase